VINTFSEIKVKFISFSLARYIVALFYCPCSNAGVRETQGTRYSLVPLQRKREREREGGVFVLSCLWLSSLKSEIYFLLFLGIANKFLFVFHASPRAHGNSFDGAGTTKFWGQCVLLSSLECILALCICFEDSSYTSCTLEEIYLKNWNRS
jgi:hypothetical protein